MEGFKPLENVDEISVCDDSFTKMDVGGDKGKYINLIRGRDNNNSLIYANNELGSRIGEYKVDQKSGICTLDSESISRYARLSEETPIVVAGASTITENWAKKNLPNKFKLKM